MIPNDSPHLSVVAFSHPGETRTNNEDRYSVTSYRIEGEETPVVLAMVADGIGGHLAGEVASRIAVETIEKRLSEASGRDPIHQLQSAIMEAGRAVSSAAEADEDQKGMGSTIAIAWVLGWRLYTAAVGDSRIYFMREGKLVQASVDHTWVQEALEHGVITPEEAVDHPNAHVLRRHLGGSNDPEPDFRLRLSPEETNQESIANQGLRLKPGDQLLICSDGLTDLVTGEEIQQHMLEHGPQEVVRELVNLARTRGGHDNITVVLLTVPEGAAASPPSRGIRRSCLLPVAFTGMLLILITLGLMGLYLAGLWPWGDNRPRPSPNPTIEGGPTATVVFDTPEVGDLDSEAGELDSGEAAGTPEVVVTPLPTP